MLPPKISTRHLTKIYYQNIFKNLSSHGEHDKSSDDEKLAVDDVSLTINSGETVGIIGCNGSGKSTLLSIIAGIATQTSGELDITGKVTAVMTLGLGLREEMTGRENIYLDGEIQGKTRQEIDVVIDEIISFAELDDFIDRPVNTYSTGMKSRLAFSMLVKIEPEILIIDEALSAGDAFFAKKASEKIKEICQKGKIVIIVSHSMATIESMCNRCIWMEKGKIIMDDVPSKTTRAYLEKVRKDDNLKTINSIQGICQSKTKDALCAIKQVNLSAVFNNQKQNAFYQGYDFSIEIHVEESQPSQAQLSIIIERLDGMCVSEKIITLRSDKPADAEYFIKTTLAPLVLNKGFFQLKIEIRENSELTNGYSQFFEVKNDYSFSGGQPLLHYPSKISLLTKESIECLDSITLTTE